MKKIIMFLTGNLLRYRLDLINYGYPNVAKEYIIIFTDRCSYDNCVSEEYKNKFNFVFIDDCRKNYPVSQKFERFLCEQDDVKYYEKLNTFYSCETGDLYPFEITRFIFIYLMENNIKNFIISDSDVVMVDDCNIIDKMLDFLNEGEFHIPRFGPGNPLPYNDFYKKYFSQKYTNLNFDVPEMRESDGYVKGFHFKNMDDMKLYFNLWNDAIELIMSDYKLFKSMGLTGCNIKIIMAAFWISPYLMHVFAHNLNYKITDCHSSFYINGSDVYHHFCRPEERIYYDFAPSYGGWENFKYINGTMSGYKSISEFIQKNKEELYVYYKHRIKPNCKLEITDDHVFVKLF